MNHIIALVRFPECIKVCIEVFSYRSIRHTCTAMKFLYIVISI